jgi:hypothetical protein
MVRSASGLAIAAGLLFPAAASAATVTNQAGSPPSISYQAAPFEVNDLTVGDVLTDSGVATAFFDGSAPLVAGAGCVTAGESVQCAPANVFARLGDGDDRASGFSSVEDLSFFGGTGDDVLQPSGSASYAEGGAGDDRIQISSNGRAEATGGSGDDILWASSGPSGFLSGDNGADYLLSARTGTLHGGAGADQIVAPEARFSSAAVYGDGGSDVLIGGSSVYGGAGDDVIVAAHDISGGDGSDWIDAQGGNVSCGAGFDTVYDEGGAVIAPDCERVRPGPAPARADVAAAQARAQTVMSPEFWH